MVFSSIPFLYYFLPGVLLLYFAAPRKLKNTVLFLASLVFYAWGEPKFVLVMLFSVFQGYCFGLLIERGSKTGAKVCLTISAVISLSLLGYCKYADFFIENFNALTHLSVPLLKVTLPIGISFYTFQILSYLVDVYRGTVPAQKNFIDLAAYIAMFPQLIAGPIVRYADISLQLKERRTSLSDCAYGIRRFVIGLSKKVIIANSLGELCTAFLNSSDKSVIFYWLYAAACTLQIYFDFSGYSDMAIGLGKILGFHFPENFNYPFISKSITEFWRRWHMSLGSWFRDYVYIPLGGNRVKRSRWFCNLLIVWFLTGFWHGAAWNFILWGLGFGVLLVAEKFLLAEIRKKSGSEKKQASLKRQSTPAATGIKVLQHVYVMLIVTLSFVIFDASTLPEAFSMFRTMFGMGGLPVVSGEALYYLKSYGIILLIAAVASTPVITKGIERLRKKETMERVLNFAEPVFLVLLLCVVTGYLADGSFNPFLYFRF